MNNTPTEATPFLTANKPQPIADRISHRPPLWTIGLYLILPFLAFPEIIFGRQTLYRTDISWIHYPGHIFMAAEWLAGRVPLWDPYRQGGVPMLAEPQIGVLYPLRLLFLSSFSPSLELSLFILLHFTLAAIFTFILARSLRLSQWAATLAGLVFGFGGFLMAQVSNLNIMSAAAWLPLIFFGFREVGRRRGWPAVLLAGSSLALQIFTAHSQIVFYTLVILTGYSLYRLSADFFFGTEAQRKNGRYAWRSGLLFAASLGLGLLVAAPQLLPTVELLQFTLRSQRQGLELLVENSLPPAMWLNLLLPGVFGNNVVGFKGGDPFQEIFIYAGFLPLLLAAVGLTGRARPGRLFFTGLLIAAGLLALGGNTPLYQYLIQYLPGFDIFRIPARWLMAVSLALAVLAGMGLDNLRENGLPGRRLAAFLGVGLLLALAIGLTWLFRVDLLAWSDILSEPYRKLAAAALTKAFVPDPIYQQRLLLRWVFGLNTPVLLLGLNLALAAILLSLYASRRISGSAFAGLTLAAVVLDLWLAGGTNINPVRPVERWQTLSGGANYVWTRVGQARVLPLGVSGEDAAVYNFGQYFPSAYGIYSASGYSSPLKLARYETFLDEADPVQALQILGVRYLLTRGQMGADVAATYPLVYSDADSVVYENKNWLPRAFVVHQSIRAASPEAALTHFQSRKVDPRRTVVLEGDNLPALLRASPAPANSTAEIVVENPQYLEIAVNAATDGYLVLLDTFYPGWEATIGGQAAPVYRANYLTRAVFVPAGQHTVRFAYRPGSFWLGVWLAVGTLGLASGALFFKAHFRETDPS